MNFAQSYLIFENLIHTQFQISVQNVGFDNGGEFMCLKDFFRENDNNHQTHSLYPNKMSVSSENIATFLT